jgi:hypothetical protein
MFGAVPFLMDDFGPILATELIPYPMPFQVQDFVLSVVPLSFLIVIVPL